MGIHEDLARISELQGKSVPSGTFIQGFGPNDPPAPTSEIPSARQMYGDPIEPAYDDDPDDVRDEAMIEPRPEVPAVPSPLIPRLGREVAPRLNPVATPPDLTVLGLHAAFRDQEVTLLDSEAAQVKKIVLRAIQRVVASRMAEVEQQLPRRAKAQSPRAGMQTRGRGTSTPKTPETSSGRGENAGSQPAGPPKRRGRPPKAKA